MRFSAVTAVCAAPLALAGTVQDVVARAAFRGDLLPRDSKSGDSNGMKDSNNNNNYNSGAQVVQSNTEEVIVIWVNEGAGAATSTVTNTVTVTASAGAPPQQTHQVTVGGTAGKVYSPNTIEANVGDMVIFTFMNQNHTATQSAFTTPCEKLTGGMDSGFLANINNTVSPPPQMAMQVTVATPVWFYCRQTGHCGAGMTFSINPTANKTQAMFEQMAIAQNGTGSTAPIAGGTSASTVAAPPPAAATGASSPPPAASSPPAAASSGVVSGTGTVDGSGSCDCSCLCGVGAFPDPASQGVAAFGGMGGAIPMASLTP